MLIVDYLSCWMFLSMTCCLIEPHCLLWLLLSIYELESLVLPVNTAALKSLLGATGQTAGERFAILDNRDKLLRAGKEKESNDFEHAVNS